MSQPTSINNGQHSRNVHRVETAGPTEPRVCTRRHGHSVMKVLEHFNSPDKPPEVIAALLERAAKVTPGPFFQELIERIAMKPTRSIAFGFRS